MGEKELGHRCCEGGDLVEGEGSRRLLIKSDQSTILTDHAVRN